MIITCISDLHGFYPKLEGGDLLIVAGDLTARDTVDEHDEFSLWLHNQDYKKIVMIAGNHDNYLQRKPLYTWNHQRIEYLCDSGTEFEGLKIWGSPWTKTFEGMNPKCKAFTKETEDELAEKWALIPDDTGILITHSPPYGILDKVNIRFYNGMPNREDRVGSQTLLEHSLRVEPLLHVFGHIHEGYGEQEYIGCRYVNASHVNERYKPVNKPIRIEL